jgi:hypothetical protein
LLGNGAGFRSQLSQSVIVKHQSENASRRHSLPPRSKSVHTPASPESLAALLFVATKLSRWLNHRLLDASNSSVTLNTLGKAARALGRKVKIELVPA